MNVIAEFVAPGLLFLLTVALGLWLSHIGKPLNPILFNVHKLVALAAVVVAAMQTVNALKIGAAQPILIALLIVIALCAAALFATGALMSANKTAYDPLLMIHKIAPPLAVVAALLALYLLGRNVYL